MQGRFLERVTSDTPLCAIFGMVNHRQEFRGHALLLYYLNEAIPSEQPRGVTLGELLSYPGIHAIPQFGEQHFEFMDSRLAQYGLRLDGGPFTEQSKGAEFLFRDYGVPLSTKLATRFRPTTRAHVNFSEIGSVDGANHPPGRIYHFQTEKAARGFAIYLNDVTRCVREGVAELDGSCRQFNGHNTDIYVSQSLINAAGTDFGALAARYQRREAKKLSQALA